MTYDIRNKDSHEEGKKRIEWAEAHMAVLGKIGERFKKEKKFEGKTIGMCLHVEPKTAILALTLRSAGAEVAMAGCNPLSTQDSAAASLAVDYDVNVFAWNGQSNEEYYGNIKKVLEFKPDFIIDDGADFISIVHKEYPEHLKKIKGASEETTTGIVRIKAMEEAKTLKFPVLNVNDAKTKHFFDNRYGTGQSTLEGIMTATNVIIAGKTVVIAGYGWCGRGAAMRAKGLGGNVIVTEIDPVKSIEAKMDGFKVMPMEEAAKYGDIFITATGNCSVVDKRHFGSLKGGAILANTGHFNVEINIPELKEASKSVKNVRKNVDEYTLKNGNKVYLLAEGRLVNLAAAQGHAIEVMDMSFANQALGIEYISKNHESLEPKLYEVPQEIDREIANMWLDSKETKIDTLTPAQEKYLSSWEHGS